MTVPFVLSSLSMSDPVPLLHIPTRVRWTSLLDFTILFSVQNDQDLEVSFLAGRGGLR